MGKPVIYFIRDDLLSKYPEDFPIVSIHPNTLEGMLENLITDTKMGHETGMRSRAFAERYHNSKAVAGKMMAL